MNLKEYYKEILNNLLTEDEQTAERQAQMKRKYNKAERAADAADAIVQKKTKVEDRAYGKYSIRRPGSIAKLHNAIKRADFARDDREELENTLSDIVNQNDRERKSRKLFGKDGKIVKEDIETPLRNAENNKAIENLQGKAKEKKRIWNKVSDPHSDLPPHSDSPEAYKASWNRRMTRAYKASDKFVAAREKLEARIALQQKEQASKFRIGLGGKRLGSKRRKTK